MSGLQMLSFFSANSVPQRRPSLIAALAVVVIGLWLSGCAKVDGSYRGVVQNQSYGVTADLFLTLKDSSGVITGDMTIGAPLYGGGAVMGRRDGSDIQFVTGDGAGGRITWIGKVAGKRLEGHYIVEPAGLNVLLGKSEKQQGMWAASR